MQRVRRRPPAAYQIGRNRNVIDSAARGVYKARRVAMKIGYLSVTLLAMLGSSTFAQDENTTPDQGQVPNQGQVQDVRDRVYYPGDTERVKPLARKLIGNVLLDQKEIWTSPFH